MKYHQRGRTYSRGVSNPYGEPNFFSSIAYLPASSSSSTVNSMKGTADGVSDGAPSLPMLPSVSPRGDNASYPVDVGERGGLSVDERLLTMVRSSSSLLQQSLSWWIPERPSSPVLYYSTLVPTLGRSSVEVLLQHATDLLLHLQTMRVRWIHNRILLATMRMERSRTVTLYNYCWKGFVLISSRGVSGTPTTRRLILHVHYK